MSIRPLGSFGLSLVLGALLATLVPARATAQATGAAPTAPGAAAPATVSQPTQPSSERPAAQPRRTMVAAPLEENERIVLDGVLDEAAWKRAVPANDFRQQDPLNGEPATEPTEVFIVYSRRALYMGVICHDSDPNKWLGYQRRRDELLQSDDRFMWNIDTFNNQQSAYFFEMNPSGLMGDSLRTATTQNRQWDGIWNAKVLRSDIGWVLEVEIPFSTLSFDANADSWGINFQRTVRRKNEESVWSGWPRNLGLLRMNAAGQVTGLRDLSQGHGIDLRPYIIGSAEAFPGRNRPEAQFDKAIGLDLIYSPKPGLRTTLTINTDFAQTEVDTRLTNLTRFPLFFPEKREFFLDGATFFDFQSTYGNNNTLLPYFTRRIGLDAGGNPQKIDVGSKLAWQYKTNDIGAMYVRTAEDGVSPGEDFMVLRAKHRMFQQSYVGMMYTGRNSRTTTAPTRSTVGVDFQLATSRFRGRQNVSLGGFLLNTTNVVDSGKNKAFGALLDLPNDPWAISILYREIQENYDAAVGFTPRVGFRQFSPFVQYTKRPRNHPWIRNAVFGVATPFQTDTRSNRLLNRDFDVNVVTLNTNSQDSYGFRILPTYERLDRNFTISRGITLPIGSDYAWTRYRLSMNSAQRRKVAFGPTYEWGGFYDGARRRIAADTNFRLRPGLIIYTSFEFNHVELAQGAFNTRLYRVVPEFQFSPWLAWVNNIQYDSQSGVVGWQSRFRWILKPGNDLYVVYTHNWLDDPLRGNIYTLDRRVASKFIYTRRF